ncbi:MAG: PHP domain-containing protein [Candidatus Levybacteria bacterium]|nr:PHP domain-containing protein [Candidatus Levybacteria bacterium]
MNNLEISKILRNVAAAYTIKDEKKFRFQIIAYHRASEIIANLPTEIRDIITDNKLNAINGIGSSLRSHIEELVKTGTVKQFEWLFDEISQAIFPLLDIQSFGPKKASKLVNYFELKNPDTVVGDILNFAKNGKIENIPTFGKKSQKDIIRSIDEFRDKKGKIIKMILPFALEIAEQIILYIKKCPSTIRVTALGSLRRMTSTVGDIDIAVATDNPDKVIKHFVSYPYKERIIEQGSTTASILTSGGKQIDLMTQPLNSYGSLLQHFTGSKNHNIKLREYALKKGYSLSEYGIKNKNGEKKIFTEEEEFYKFIGLQWVPPEIREDKGEIELAIKNQLPNLVTLDDIKGDLHIHSNYPIEPSHDLGKNTMQDMINKANELGYEYLGFSEHNPSVSRHTKNQTYSILARRNEAIEQLKESNKNIRILNLLELDILSSGELAIDEKSLELVDAVLISIHSSFGMQKDIMTKRILNGFSHPKAKIFSHPTGRLLNERNGYDVNFEKLFLFSKDNNKALEINGSIKRLDLPDIIIKEAISHGVKMIINTDSHDVSQMNQMRYGVSVARRGWAESKDILNTLNYDNFIKWIKNK